MSDTEKTGPIEHPYNMKHSSIPHGNDDSAVIHRDMGGSIAIGGGLPDDIKAAYHHVLKMSPHQHEMYREIATQLLGGVPNLMWGNLVGDNSHQLEAPAEEYENIIDMNNPHATGMMLATDTGGSFFSALKHVGRIAADVYKKGRLAAHFLYDNRKPILRGFGLEGYEPAISEFASRMSDLDSVINPLVDKTLKATNVNPSDDVRAKVRQIAKEQLHNSASNVAKDIYIRR